MQISTRFSGENQLTFWRDIHLIFIWLSADNQLSFLSMVNVYKYKKM